MAQIKRVFQTQFPYRLDWIEGDHNHRIRIENRVKELDIGGNEYIADIKIGQAISSIADQCFYKSENLSSVTFISAGTAPDGTEYHGTIMKNIGREAFSYCSSLSSIVFNDDYAGNIKKGAFRSTSLSSIKISSDGTIAGYQFIGDKYIKTAEITGNIGANAFAYCSSMTDVEITFNDGKLHNGLFKDCTKLSSITLNNLQYVDIEDDSECRDSLKVYNLGIQSYINEYDIDYYQSFDPQFSNTRLVPEQLRTTPRARMFTIRGIYSDTDPNHRGSLYNGFCSHLLNKCPQKYGISKSGVQISKFAPFQNLTEISCIYIPKTIKSLKFSKTCGLPITFQYFDEYVQTNRNATGTLTASPSDTQLFWNCPNLLCVIFEDGAIANMNNDGISEWLFAGINPRGTCSVIIADTTAEDLYKKFGETYTKMKDNALSCNDLNDPLGTVRFLEKDSEYHGGGNKDRLDTVDVNGELLTISADPERGQYWEDSVDTMLNLTPVITEEIRNAQIIITTDTETVGIITDGVGDNPEDI